MMAQPGSARNPNAVFGIVAGSGPTPEVGVVMQNPPTGVVVGLGRLPTADGTVINQGEQGLVAFGKVADLRRPVAHL